jgi:acetyl-CoA synthetase
MQKFEKFPDWQWIVPKHFNIGAACTDKHLNTTAAKTIAMIVEDDVHGTSQITFEQLAKRTDKFAQLLRNLNVGAGDRVLIRLPNNLDYPTAFLGAMKRGAISVPTSTLLTAEEVAYLARDSGAAVLVTDKAAWPSLQDQLSGLPNLKHVLLSGSGEVVSHVTLNVCDLETQLSAIETCMPTHLTAADDHAYLVYTSGTTGYPKGVLHAHRALIGREPASKYWFNFDANSQDRIMHSGKFNWTYVLGSGLMDPLYLGKTVIVHEGKNDADLSPNHTKIKSHASRCAKLATLHECRRTFIR